eukprot:5025717-Pyramimonas_sp.AAC.1
MTHGAMRMGAPRRVSGVPAWAGAVGGRVRTAPLGLRWSPLWAAKHVRGVPQLSMECIRALPLGPS